LFSYLSVLGFFLVVLDKVICLEMLNIVKLFMTPSCMWGRLQKETAIEYTKAKFRSILELKG